MDTEPVDDTSWQNLAEAQWQVATRQQLLDAKVTESQLRWRLGRRWRLLLPGVVLLDSGQPTRWQQILAAQLFAGDRAWVAGQTALHVLYRGATPFVQPVEIWVPRPLRARSHAWVKISSTRISDEPIVERGPLRVSCLPRALIDAAARAPTDADAIAVLVDAVRERRVLLDHLMHWALCRGRVGSRRVMVALEAAARNAWSVPENDLIELVGTSKVLPIPWSIRS